MKCERKSHNLSNLDSVCVCVCVCVYRAKAELAVVPWVSREQCFARVLAKSRVMFDGYAIAYPSQFLLLNQFLIFSPELFLYLHTPNMYVSVLLCRKQRGAVMMAQAVKRRRRRGERERFPCTMTDHIIHTSFPQPLLIILPADKHSSS